MKILHLTMQAFGPYSSHVELDMTNLTDSGLYLICGDTGSGKTMLFDAVTYALYGKSSGEVRDSAMLRSKSAGEGVMSYVELTFENAGQKYTVYREIGREKVRGGEAVFEKSMTASLTLPDGRIVNRHKDVTEAVSSIIGLDADRFCQTVMIAQGEFRRLLLAGTEERVKVLRQIFKTDEYSLFAARAKEKAAKSKQKCDGLIYTAGRFSEMIEPISDELGRILKNGIGCVPRERLVELLTQELDCEDEVAEKLKNARDKRSDKLRELQAQLIRAEIDVKTTARLKVSEKEMSDALDKMKKSEEDLSENERRTREAEEADGNVLQLRGMVDSFTERDGLRRDCAAAEAELEVIAAKIEAGERNIALFDEKAEAVNGIIEKEKSSLGDRSENTAALAVCEGEKNAVAELEKKTASYDKLLEEIKFFTGKYIQARSEAEKAREESDRCTRVYFDSIAGILSSCLEDGKPCPVCGSTTHPDPAKAEENAISREELDRLKEASSGAEAVLENYAVKLNSDKGAASNLHMEILSSPVMAEFSSFVSPDDNPVDEMKQYLKKKRLENGKKIESINLAILKYDKSLEKIRLCEDQLRLIQRSAEEEKDALGQYSLKYTVVESAYGEKKERLARLDEKLPSGTAEELKVRIDECSAKAASLRSRIKSAEDDYGRAQMEYERIKSVCENLREQLRDSIADSYGEIRDSCGEAKEKLDKIEAELTRRVGILNSNRNAARQLWLNLKKLDEEEEKHRIYASISDTANGCVKGKEKIMLETFRQMRLFERMVRRANIRLMQMSDGRYEMVRRENAANRRSQSGLELDIIDHWNGRERDVRTLSGGESFMSSLALALALSDETEAEAGGVRIDSMFIDEGFGLLDDDSLDGALRVLESQSGGRSVGIISHVAGLRERIDRKIVVTKAQDSSRAEVVVGKG